MPAPAARTAALAFLLLVLTVIAPAAEPNSFAGTWVFRIGQRNLFVLTLIADGDRFHGAFDRPAKMSSTGNLFSNISSTVAHDTISKGEVKDGVLHITVQDATDPKDTDVYAMTVSGNQAELAYDDLPPASSSNRALLSVLRQARPCRPNGSATAPTPSATSTSPTLK